MLELTRKPNTEGMTDICLRVPTRDALRISKAIRGVLDEAGETVREVDTEDDGLFTLEQTFPDGTPGAMLRGTRFKEDITQAQLAEASGIPRRHISEMEKADAPSARKGPNAWLKHSRWITGYSCEQIHRCERIPLGLGGDHHLEM
jgi:DNA-binding XRE family transcriptional regulator